MVLELHPHISVNWAFQGIIGNALKRPENLEYYPFLHLI